MNFIKKTGLLLLRSLVFSFLLTACLARKENALSVLWEESKAIGVVIPQNLLPAIPEDSLLKTLRVRLANSNASVLGDYTDEGSNIIFRPLIAFTHGLTYQVYAGKQLIGTVEIPPADTDAPVIAAVYPKGDTLPENLLKFYIQFSKPMQEGEALKHIHLIKEGGDTLSSVFLDLQQELWNNDRTILTLWLDPGRIKRDLQPNKRLGPPLNKGQHYQFIIDNNWQSAEGIILKENHVKDFITTFRDSLSPDLQNWTIDAPARETKEQLVIHFDESMDPILAENTIRIFDHADKEVKGLFRVHDTGSILFFHPDIEWVPGAYYLQVESRLEDLAGNNLNRLFDTDLTQKQKEPRDMFKRAFTIE